MRKDDIVHEMHCIQKKSIVKGTSRFKGYVLGSFLLPCNKLPQTKWLETTPAYYLTVL